MLTTTGNASRFCVEAGLVEAPPPAPEPTAAPSRPWRAPGARPRERAPKGATTAYEIARAAIRDPGVDPRRVLGACASLATAQRVVALAVRSADAPCVERLTGGQLADPLHELAADRGSELSITVPEPDASIADLADPARRATADALKPRSSPIPGA